MIRIPLAAALCLAACMAPPEEAKVQRTTWRDLTIETRSLRADTTFSAVGLRPSGERDDGSTDWDTSFTDERGAVDGDFVRRDFRLTIRNRGEVAREFHARIDYLSSDGELLRRRSLDRMVVAPFTEMTWIGADMIRNSGEPEVLARVLPVSEPFEPEAQSSARSRAVS